MRSRAWLVLPAVLLLSAALEVSLDGFERWHLRLQGFELAVGPDPGGSAWVDVLDISGFPPSSWPDANVSQGPRRRLRSARLPVDQADRPIILQLKDQGSVVAAPWEGRLRCPIGTESMAALTGGGRWTDDLSGTCHFRLLEQGDRITLFGDKTFDFVSDERGWGLRLGACDLRPDEALSLEARVRNRLRGGARSYALLDFYHHDASCKPSRLDRGSFDSERWVSIDNAAESGGRGRYKVPMRSFLVRVDGEIWLSLLDAPDTVTFEPKRARPNADPTHHLTPEVGEKTALRLLRRRFSMRKDRLVERASCESDESCWCAYDHQGFCQRLSVAVVGETFHLQRNESRLRVEISRDQQKLYTVGVRIARRGQRPMDPETDTRLGYTANLSPVPGMRNLSYPIALEGGDFVRAVFDLAPMCDGDQAGCIDVSTLAGRTRWLNGDVVTLGRLGLDPTEPLGGDFHFVQVTIMDSLSGIVACSCIALLIYALLLWPLLKSNVSRAGFLFLTSGLSLRLLIAYKVFVLYPYEMEGLSSAWRALVWVPAIYALTCWVWQTGWLQRLAERRSQVGWVAKAESWLPVAAILLLFLGRLGLAAIGLEKLGPLRLDLVFVPAALLAGAWLWNSWRSSNWFWWYIVRGAAGALPIAASIVPGGDKGTVLTIGPALLIGWFFLVEEGRWRSGTKFLAALVGVCLISFWWLKPGMMVLPPTAIETVDWTESDGNRCPTGEANSQPGMPIDVASYREAFEADNLAIRAAVFFQPDAPRRIGTLEADQIAEFLAVLRRYSQGKDGNWFGDGYLQNELRRFSSNIVRTQLYDAVVATVVLPDFGTVGLVGVLLLYCGWIPIALAVRSYPPTGGLAFVPLAGRLGALAISSTALYMVAGNLQILPLTGKNVPFLSVLSGSDLVLATVLTCMAATSDVGVDDAR